MFNSRKKIVSFGFLFLLNLSQFSYAQSFKDTVTQNGNFYFSVGGAFMHQGKTQHINIAGLIGDDFRVTSHNDAGLLLGAGYFVKALEQPQYVVRYGLNAFYFSNTAVNGQVYQENVFNNLSYKYYVMNLPIYLAGKMEFNTSPNYSVVLDAGIGPNIIQTSGFREHSNDGITLPDRIFAGDTNVVLSGSVGIGVKFNGVKFNSSGPLECGYRFFYLGQGNLEKINNQVRSTLTNGNAYANTLLCSIAV